MTVRPDFTEDQATVVLRAALDDPTAELRDGQWQIIDRLVNDRERVLAVQPTGWGKSMVYFIATRALRDRGFGPTLIISPLLALMRDQRLAAGRIGLRGEFITSENTDHWQVVYDRIDNDAVDLLLVSPERLANNDFRTDVLEPMLDSSGSMIVVDEAHCISDWGHDFRPDYRRIRAILDLLPAGVPVLGTTATANDRVARDVKEQFGRSTNVVRGPLARPSLRIQSLNLRTRVERLAWLVSHLGEFPGSGIIYVLTRRDAEQVARFLNAEGHDVRPYYRKDRDHDGPSDETLEIALRENRVKALVATTKLGMGFDKPDLGFVVHYQLPGNVVAYYQQIGRAGRAIDEAICVLMHGDEDLDISTHFIETAVPSEDLVDGILTAVEDADGLRLTDLCRKLNVRQNRMQHALVYLMSERPAPLLRDGYHYRRTPARWTYDAEGVKQRKAMRYDELRQMLRLASAHGECMMLPMLLALDDADPRPCGRCEGCTGAPAISPDVPAEVIVRAEQALRLLDMPIEPRQMWPMGGVMRNGVSVRGRIDPELVLEQGRVLCRWADPGIGRLARESRQAHTLDARLSEQLVDLVINRWWPDTSPPTWITAVPSWSNAKLIEDAVACIADARGLKIVDAAVIRVADRPAQKSMHTSPLQAQNVEGAFEVDRSVLPAGEPGILFDDAVDSRWTFTIIGSLLRAAGSGPVYPLALVDTAGMTPDQEQRTDAE